MVAALGNRLGNERKPGDLMVRDLKTVNPLEVGDPKVRKTSILFVN